MSSRKIFVSIVLFTVCLIGQTSSLAFGKPSKVLYAEPARLMLPGDENAAADEQEGRLLREKFYPIGWSKTGAFAYYVEPADEACGCYFGELVIQDLRTDKILWKHQYTSDGSSTITLKQYWAKNRRGFSRKLAEYGIIAPGKFPLQTSAINYQKDILTPEITSEVTPGDSGYDVSGSVVISLISKLKGKKTIYEKIFDPKKIEAFRGAAISGSLLSPYEARAAIVVAETHRGYEGPPNITRIRIVGATLNGGFK